MRARVVLTAVALSLVAAPAAAAELRVGTRIDPVGDVTSGGGLRPVAASPSQDIAQVDVRYDTAGDLVIDITTAGDIAAGPTTLFNAYLTSPGGSNCGGHEIVTDFSVSVSSDPKQQLGTWTLLDTNLRKGIGGFAQVTRTGRRLALRVADPALRDRAFMCVGVTSAAPGDDPWTQYSSIFRDNIGPYVYLSVVRPPVVAKVKRCPRTSLQGKTLKAATKALTKAGCAVGQVRRPKSAGSRKLVVRRAFAANAARQVDLVLKVKR